MKTNNPIDELFKKNLKNFETQPNASVWEKIESNLDTQTPHSTSWKAIAAAILLLITTGTLFMYESSAVLEPEKMTPINPISVKPLNTNAQINQSITINNSEPTNVEKTDYTQEKKLMAEVYQKPIQASDLFDDSQISDDINYPDNYDNLPFLLADASVLNQKKLSIKLNPENYLTASSQPSTDLKEYSLSQINNLRKGRSIEAPEEVKSFTWPAFKEQVSSFFSQENN